MTILEPNGHLALIHTCERVKLLTACFLGSDVQNFPLSRSIWSPFFFFLNLVLCCSYQNLCWSSGLFFFFRSLQTIQNSYLQNMIYPRGLQRTVMWKASQIFSLVSVFCCFFLWAKVILYSVLVYQKHQYLKTSFVEKLSRKSFTALL